VERAQIAETEAPVARLAVPVGRQDREGQPEVVDLSAVPFAPVVGGVQEVRHPWGGVAAGDRRAGHAREAQRSRARHRALALLVHRLEVLGHLRKLVLLQRRRVLGHVNSFRSGRRFSGRATCARVAKRPVVVSLPTLTADKHSSIRAWPAPASVVRRSPSIPARSPQPRRRALDRGRHEPEHAWNDVVARTGGRCRSAVRATCSRIVAGHRTPERERLASLAVISSPRMPPQSAPAGP
jgi:hypothetical protein